MVAPDCISGVDCEQQHLGLAVYDFFGIIRVEFLDERARDELHAFPVDIRARFERVVHMIETLGLERIREPYVKHLEASVWEVRMKGKDGIVRAACVTAKGRRVVVVHVFGKKTRKTPRGAIRIALARAEEVT